MAKKGSTRPSRRRGKKGKKVHADAKFKKAEDLVIEAQAKALGDPEVTLMQVHTIENVGQTYTGNWYLQGSKHRIGDGGYEMEMRYLRNASKKPAAASPKKPSGSGTTTNNKKAKPSNGRGRKPANNPKVKIRR